MRGEDWGDTPLGDTGVVLVLAALVVGVVLIATSSAVGELIEGQAPWVATSRAEG